MVPEENPYICLGLLPGSSAADIKCRYRQLAKQYHPDTNREASAEETLRALNAAYAFLSDPRRKAAYDTVFEARAAAYNPARAPQPAQAHRRRGPSQALIGFTLLFLLSTGAGFLFRAENVGLVLSGLYSRLSSRSTGPDRPPPSYSFLPSHGAFDDTSSAAPSSNTSDADASVPDTSVPNTANQAGLP